MCSGSGVLISDRGGVIGMFHPYMCRETSLSAATDGADIFMETQTHLGKLLGALEIRRFGGGGGKGWNKGWKGRGKSVEVHRKEDG